MNKPEDRELRDEALAASLRNALGEGRAPESWVREALSVPARLHPSAPDTKPARPRAASPARAGGVPAPTSREPWLLTLFPHLAGVALLGGLAVTWCVRPELMRGALEPTAAFLDETFAGGGPGFWTLAGLLVPVVVLFIEQGARGFPIVRRLGLRH